MVSNQRYLPRKPQKPYRKVTYMNRLHSDGRCAPEEGVG
jgi:hypothetical protein